MRALTMFGLYTTSLGMAHLFSLLLLDYWYVGFLPYLGLSTWLFIRWYSKKRKTYFKSTKINLGTATGFVVPTNNAFKNK